MTSVMYSSKVTMIINNESNCEIVLDQGTHMAVTEMHLHSYDLFNFLTLADTWEMFFPHWYAGG